MKGKILGSGFISGDDGQQYTFYKTDILNLENRDIAQLQGVEVDFEVNGGAIAQKIFF